MRRTVPSVTRAGMVGAVISALILAGLPANVLATGTPLFQPYEAIPFGAFARTVAIGDVTGDGRNDVVMTSDSFGPGPDFRLWVFAQAPDGTLLAPVWYRSDPVWGPGSVAVGDITGDGKADVVLGSFSGGGIKVFPQVADGTLGTPTLYPTEDSFKIRLGQLNGDGLLDVAGVGSQWNTVSVFLNDGHGGLLPPTSYPAKNLKPDLEVADVSGDGRDDLVVMSAAGGPNISVLAQKAGGGFEPAAEYRLNPFQNTDAIGVGDVTGDGRKDVVATYGGNLPNSRVAVFVQTGAGKLAAPVRYPSFDLPGAVAVADLDLDGRADVLTMHDSWVYAGVYRQRGNGTLAPEELYALPGNDATFDQHGIAVGDINSDGAPDVVGADPQNGLVVLRNATPPAAHVWVGLRNSDDVGIRFDLRAKVYLNDTLVTSGEANGVAAGSSGFPRAVLDAIPINPYAPVTAPPGSRLSVRLDVRNACSGSAHNSGVARLWYDDSTANSWFPVTISGSASTYYLVSGNNLSTSPGAGPRASIDIEAGARCSPYKSFGTWSLLIP